MATFALQHIRLTGVNYTPVGILFASSGDHWTIRGYNFINPNPYPVYVKFYDETSGSVTVGTTSVNGCIEVPANGSSVDMIVPDGLYRDFVNAISVACTRYLEDSDTTRVHKGIEVELKFQQVI